MSIEPNLIDNQDGNPVVLRSVAEDLSTLTGIEWSYIPELAARPYSRNVERILEWLKEQEAISAFEKKGDRLVVWAPNPKKLKQLEHF